MQSSNPAAVTAQQQATWDRHVAVYTEVVIGKDLLDLASVQVISAIKQQKKLATGARVLDTASSSGRPAVPLAKAFPQAQVTSTDLSPNSSALVLKYADAQGVTNVTAQAADAQNLQDFADSTFAVVTCTYGLFFMPEATKALREAFRVLQPGGLFVASVWGWPDQVQMSEVFQKTMAILSGKPSQPPDISKMLPWDIGTPSNLTQALADANFTNVRCAEFQHPLHPEIPDLIQLIAGPNGQFRPMLEQMKASGRGDIYQEAAQAVQEAALQIGEVENGVVHLENKALLFTASKP